MDGNEKEFLAYAAVSNRTMQGIEEGVAFIVEQIGCSKQEAFDIIAEMIQKRMEKDKKIS